MTTPHILPAEASPVGKYRGIYVCTATDTWKRAAIATWA